ncbi:hypothetical protein [Sphingobacterium sp. SYP-B4668]|uniref:hypothetical protein n=1 Tax=Sphingobacterium sp. SYP-B4668 TaxID=2996035 RepID=UPI0022DD6303|nr:hypothetical protein [Sphingobacterium sp. SYP-B4668]
MWSVSHACSRFVRALVYLLDDSYFIGYSISWILIRFTRQGGHPIPLLNNWLTDFVFVPLIIHVSQAVGIYFLQTKKPFRYPLFQILLISLATSYVFEWMMPEFTIHHTSDLWDVVVYFLGGMFYYYVHQPYTHKRYNFS